jgi:hypothetical protein
VKKTMIAAILCLLAAATAFAQAQPATPAPEYILSGGLGFNHYDARQFTGELSFSTRLADGMFKITTLKMSSKGDRKPGAAQASGGTGRGLRAEELDSADAVLRRSGSGHRQQSHRAVSAGLRSGPQQLDVLRQRSRRTHCGDSAQLC